MDNWKTVPGFCPNTSFTVKGLNEGKRYVFKVKAENMYGVSEPLEGSPIMAKSPFDPPDAPGQPEVTNYSPNTCSLSWTPPFNTGGRPITGKMQPNIFFKLINHYLILNLLLLFRLYSTKERKRW